MPSPLIQALAYQNSVSPAQSGIAPTDVIGSYKLASDVAEKNYQAQLAKQQAMWGGLAGIGSAGALAFGPSLAKKYFGAGSTAASPTAATAPASVASPVADAGAAASTSPVAAFEPLGADALGLGGGAPTVAADLGLGGADAVGTGTVAADLGLGGAAATGADAAGTAALAGLPDWLAAMLPFMAV